MARATGKDVIVRLLEEVEALRADMDNMADAFDVVTTSIEHLRDMARSSSKHLNQMAKILNEVGSRLNDHESRIRSLEKRAG